MHDDATEYRNGAMSAFRLALRELGSHPRFSDATVALYAHRDAAPSVATDPNQRGYARAMEVALRDLNQHAGNAKNAMASIRLRLAALDDEDPVGAARAKRARGRDYRQGNVKRLNMKTPGRCPRCGGPLPIGYPGARSRWDDATEICSDCGAGEANGTYVTCHWCAGTGGLAPGYDSAGHLIDGPQCEVCEGAGEL